MSFVYNIDPKSMFEDRFEQFVTLGIAREEVAAMQNAIRDMWADAPGGWPFEWSRLARKYADSGQQLMASLAYGCAKFPCLADDARRTALANQLASYLAAAPGFPVRFERRTLDLPYLGATIAVPVHLYSTSGEYQRTPVFMTSGGVDSWKMDMHAMCVAFAQRLRVTVLAFDHPGTGENPARLSIEGDTIVLGVAEQARKIGNGKVAHLGVSFGGNYAAMTGLMGAVDASIVLGGPVDKAFATEALRNLPYGMPGIIGNDMGFDHEPSMPEFIGELQKLSRRSLLDRQNNAPMLVINGANDYFVPQADTLLFTGRQATDVHLLPGTGHCAFSRLPEVMLSILQWLPQKIGQDVRQTESGRIGIPANGAG